ncbi:hypothetical protein JCM10207_003347 [Rhodosporidiobolus poonsookiae]
MPDRRVDSILSLREYGIAAERIAKEFEAVDTAADFDFAPSELGATACWALKLGATGDLNILLDHVKLDTEILMSSLFTPKPKAHPDQIYERLYEMSEEVEHKMSGGAHKDQGYVLIPASPNGPTREIRVVFLTPTQYYRPPESRYSSCYHTFPSNHSGRPHSHLPTGSFLLFSTVEEIEGHLNHSGHHKYAAGGLDLPFNRKSRDFFFHRKMLEVLLLYLLVGIPSAQGERAVDLDPSHWRTLVTCDPPDQVRERYLAVQSWILHGGVSEHRAQLVDGTARFLLDQPGGLKHEMSHATLHGLIEAALQYCEGFFTTHHTTGQTVRPSLGIRSLGVAHHATAFQPVSRRDGSF